MPKRRDFLKFLGGAVGGVVLSSCGGSAGGGFASMPNGYRYYRLFNDTDTLPGGGPGTVELLPGSAMLNERDEIFFHALDTSGAMGVYEMKIDYTTEPPKVLSLRKVVRAGDTLADGTKVGKVGPGDINRTGSYATVIQRDDEGKIGVYLDSDKSGLRHVVGYRDATPGHDGMFGMDFGDLDLHDGDDMLFTGRYGSAETGRTHQGVFHVPGGVVGSASSLITHSGLMTPDSDGLIRSFGLVDMNDGGRYVLQSNASLRLSVSARTGEEAQAAMLLTGAVHDPASLRLLSAPRNMPVSAYARSSAAFVQAGESVYGPRIGDTGKVAHVVHVTDDSMALYFHDEQVAATGELSPKGDEITSFAPPVVGDNKLLYYTAFTTQGMELIVYNGESKMTILSRGDTLRYDGDNVVTTIIFGSMTQQVDTAGRLAMICEYNNNTSAVVVGVPV